MKPATLIRILLIVISALTGTRAMLSQSSQNSSLHDPVAELGRRIEQGIAKLDYDSSGWGYLRSLLKHLDVNVDSQILVFSKTSFQLMKIGPETPRAIYFNDQVAVGTVQEGTVFELASLDPKQGLIFYTIDTEQTAKPRFERRFTECLNCHGPASGLVISSVYPSADGTPFVTGTFFEGIDHRTPLENRWGGWYVSGTHGAVRHLGNAVALDQDHPFDLEQDGTQNLTSLAAKFDVDKYLAPTSDIVALMTMEHQARMTNLLAGLSQQFRRALDNGTIESSRGSLDRAVEQVVDYMLFADEAPLRDPVKGTSTFTETFPQRGLRDKEGRSLRDFDLQNRLFRYPLSYMIYSEVFDAMPAVARDRVYRRLYDVLTGRTPGPKFVHLSNVDRDAILYIVADTKGGLPDYWNPPTLVGARQ
jgi:hypothetical protein